MNALSGRARRAWTLRGTVEFLLLAAFLMVVLIGISLPVSSRDVSLFLFVAGIGLVVGWFTGKIPVRAGAAALADIVLGMDVILVLIGRLDLLLAKFFHSAASFGGEFLAGNRVGMPDASPVLAALQGFLMGPVVEAIHLRNWAFSILRGEHAVNPVASTLFWLIVFYAISSFAGWAFSSRKEIFAAVLPAVLLHGITLVAFHGNWNYAVGTAAMVLLLMVVEEHSRKEKEWGRKRMGYSTMVRSDLMLSSAPILIVLILAAMIIPSISLADFSKWVQERWQNTGQSGPTVSNVYGPVPTRGNSQGFTSEDLHQSHILGGAVHLTNNVKLLITTGETPLYLPGNPDPVYPVHYWRFESYNFYSGLGWYSGTTTEREQEPQKNTYTDLPQGFVLHQSVMVARFGGGPLYFTGELISANLPFWGAWRTNDDLFGAVIEAPRYEVDSIVVQTDEAELRAAGSSYPDWIIERYLQLPQVLPQRVLTLARDLTATRLTAYDQALAIQDYLRKGMRYSTDIKSPVRNHDVVDQFLFITKVGYCDYFASAMAVLARAAGIPARMVLGYSSGTFIPESGKFVVLESNSHSWPELYFPGIGWVAFEPTPAVPMIQYSLPTSLFIPGPPLPDGKISPLAALGNTVVGILRRVALWGLIGFLVLPAGYLLWILFLPLRLSFLPASRLPHALYHGLLAHGRRLGIQVGPATTPQEFALALAGILPAGGELPAKVVHWYSRQVYGGRKITAAERKEALRVGPRLDRKLWGTWLRWKFQRGPRPR